MSEWRKGSVRIEGDQVIDQDGVAYDVRKAIAEIPWVASVKYPPPHFYIVKTRCPAEPWAVLAAFIRDHPDGYDAYWRGYQRPMHYLDFEGYRYWRTASSGFGGGVTHMLNRCTFDSAEPGRRVNQGGQPNPNHVGPPWAVDGSEWPAWYTLGEDGQYHYQSKLDPFRPGSRKPKP